MLKASTVFLAFVLTFSIDSIAREPLSFTKINETTFDLGSECFQHGPYNVETRNSECLVQGRLRIYLKSFLPVSPKSSHEREAIDCRWLVQKQSRKGSLAGQQVIDELIKFDQSLAGRCFWVPSVESSLFSSRRLIKVLKTHKIYNDQELPKLGCSDVWSACEFIDRHSPAQSP
jgi:hypothetical protein